MEAPKPSQKLKILCLHGLKQSKEWMEYEMRGFVKLYEKVAEFTFLQAPYEENNDPWPFMTEKGWKPPFY